MGAASPGLRSEASGNSRYFKAGIGSAFGVTTSARSTSHVSGGGLSSARTGAARTRAASKQNQRGKRTIGEHSFGQREAGGGFGCFGVRRLDAALDLLVGLAR